MIRGREKTNNCPRRVHTIYVLICLILIVLLAVSCTFNSIQARDKSSCDCDKRGKNIVLKKGEKIQDLVDYYKKRLNIEEGSIKKKKREIISDETITFNQIPGEQVENVNYSQLVLVKNMQLNEDRGRKSLIGRIRDNIPYGKRRIKSCINYYRHMDVEPYYRCDYRLITNDLRGQFRNEGNYWKNLSEASSSPVLDDYISNDMIIELEDLRIQYYLRNRYMKPKTVRGTDMYLISDRYSFTSETINLKLIKPYPCCLMNLDTISAQVKKCCTRTVTGKLITGSINFGLKKEIIKRFSEMFGDSGQIGHELCEIYKSNISLNGTSGNWMVIPCSDIQRSGCFKESRGCLADSSQEDNLEAIFIMGGSLT
ncbi:MAG: hypothetical protein FMLXV2_gp6 [Fushun monolepta lauta xinmovirus 2]|uniref:Uncharacterized protein n=1 Tax=Fushun monolepta lauta xinmovirus 2 TaxID=2905555 RepID=A0A8K1XFI8_9MONO|nr:MAG: hypothetical protein FMLXV2_gp6 [Fushun monolepta lauta xinmovirus 2]